MDDGILIHESKEYLKYCLEKIKEILEEYGLELNEKTKIYTKKEGVTFLGFHFKIKNNKVTAIRFSTLAAICEVLNCEAGDILEFQKD